MKETCCQFRDEDYNDTILRKALFGLSSSSSSPVRTTGERILPPTLFFSSLRPCNVISLRWMQQHRPQVNVRPNTRSLPAYARQEAVVTGVQVSFKHIFKLYGGATAGKSGVSGVYFSVGPSRVRSRTVMTDPEPASSGKVVFVHVSGSWWYISILEHGVS